MKKINRNYSSFIEYFGLTKNDTGMPGNYKNKRYLDGSNQNPVVLTYYVTIPYHKIYPKYQLMGAFYPLVKIKKDFMDTFKPYYSIGKFKRDLFQPLRGFLNILNGIISLIGAMSFLLIWPFALLVSCFLWMILPPTVVFSHIIYPISWGIEGGLNCIRGVSQILSTPLVYLFKIPLRGLLTFFNTNTQYAENKPEIQRLVNEALKESTSINDALRALDEDTLSMRVKNQLESSNTMLSTEEGIELFNRSLPPSQEGIKSIIHEIHRKYNKSINDGWKSKVSPENEEKSFLFVYSLFNKKLESGSMCTFDILKMKAARDNSVKLTTDSMSQVTPYLNNFL